MYILDAVLKGLIIGMFMAVSMGPTLFAVINYSLHHCYRSGIAFILGVAVSDILYVFVANAASPWLLLLAEHKRLIGFGGGILLIIVGIASLLRKKVTGNSAPVTTRGHFFKIGLRGFLINTLNPGVIIVWIGAVAAVANTSVKYRLVLFGSALGLNLVFDLIKVFAADKIKSKLVPKRMLFFQKLSSVFLLILGLALLIGVAINFQYKGT